MASASILDLPPGLKKGFSKSRCTYYYLSGKVSFRTEFLKKCPYEHNVICPSEHGKYHVISCVFPELV